jgi:hypothetical protein
LLKIRARFDKPVDLTPLLDEIHETFGDALYNAAVESTPVRSGVTSSSWHQTRTNDHKTEITNDSMVGTYQILSLLHEGTKPHRVGSFWWRAAGAQMRSGLKVHIDPNFIAVRAMEAPRGLPEVKYKNEKQRYFAAVEFYSYHEDLTNAIDKGVELAVRRMSN